MADFNEDIVIDIKIKYQDAIMGIANLTEQTKSLQAEQKSLQQQQKELDEQYKSGTKSVADYAAENNKLRSKMAATTEAIKLKKSQMQVLSKEVQNNIKSEQKYGDSLNSMRAQLSNMKSEYANLTAEQREAAKGTGGLLEQIANLNSKLKGRFNYQMQLYKFLIICIFCLLK